jgi:hypothetical protein
MHGGKSTGPRTPAGRARSRKANWKHGRYAQTDTEQINMKLAELLRLSRKCAAFLEEVLKALQDRAFAISNNPQLLCDAKYRSVLPPAECEQISKMYESWRGLDPNGTVVPLSLEWLRLFSKPVWVRLRSSERAWQRWFEAEETVYNATKSYFDVFADLADAKHSDLVVIAGHL